MWADKLFHHHNLIPGYFLACCVAAAQGDWIGLTESFWSNRWIYPRLLWFKKSARFTPPPPAGRTGILKKPSELVAIKLHHICSETALDFAFLCAFAFVSLTGKVLGAPLTRTFFKYFKIFFKKKKKERKIQKNRIFCCKEAEDVGALQCWAAGRTWKKAKICLSFWRH